MAKTQGTILKERLDVIEPNVSDNINNITTNTNRINQTDQVLGLTNDAVVSNNQASISRDNDLSARIDTIEQTQLLDTSTSVNEIEIDYDVSTLIDEDGLRILIEKDTNKNSLPSLDIKFSDASTKKTYIVNAGTIQDVTNFNLERGAVYLFRYLTSKTFPLESGGTFDVTDGFIHDIDVATNLRIDELERKTMNQDSTSSSTDFIGNVTTTGAVMANNVDLGKSTLENKEGIEELRKGLDVVLEKPEDYWYNLKGLSKVVTPIEVNKVIHINVPIFTPVEKDDDTYVLQLSIDDGTTYIEILEVDDNPITFEDLNEISGKIMVLKATTATKWTYSGTVESNKETQERVKRLEQKVTLVDFADTHTQEEIWEEFKNNHNSDIWTKGKSLLWNGGDRIYNLNVMFKTDTLIELSGFATLVSDGSVENIEFFVMDDITSPITLLPSKFKATTPTSTDEDTVVATKGYVDSASGGLQFETVTAQDRISVLNDISQGNTFNIRVAVSNFIPITSIDSNSSYWSYNGNFYNSSTISIRYERIASSTSILKTTEEIKLSIEEQNKINDPIIDAIHNKK